MAINKKLIHFQTLENFNTQLSAGNILDTSICFIKDAKKIWTHGEFYDCSESEAIDTSKFVDLSANVTNLAEDDLLLHATNGLWFIARYGNAILQSRNENTYIQADGNIYLDPNYYGETEGKVLYHGVEVATKNNIPDTSTLIQLGKNTTDQVVSLDADTITLNATENTVNIDGTTGVNITTNYDGDINIKTGSVGDVNIGTTEGDITIDASGGLNIKADTDDKGISIGTDIEVNANNGNVALNGASVLVNGVQVATIDDIPSSSGGIATTALPLVRISSVSDGETLALDADTVYMVVGTVRAPITLTFNPAPSEYADYYHEWMFVFTASSSTTITVSSGVSWAGDEIPTFESGYTYELSFTKKNSYYLGVCSQKYLSLE